MCRRIDIDLSTLSWLRHLVQGDLRDDAANVWRVIRTTPLTIGKHLMTAPRFLLKINGRPEDNMSEMCTRFSC